MQGLFDVKLRQIPQTPEKKQPRPRNSRISQKSHQTGIVCTNPDCCAIWEEREKIFSAAGTTLKPIGNTGGLMCYPYRIVWYRVSFYTRIIRG